MAKPIEPTPVLEGENAKAFWESLAALKFDERKELQLDKSRAIYRLMFPK